MLGHSPSDLEPVLLVQADRWDILFLDGEHGLLAQTQDRPEQDRGDAHSSILGAHPESQHVDERRVSLAAHYVSGSLAIDVHEVAEAAAQVMEQRALVEVVVGEQVVLERDNLLDVTRQCMPESVESHE